MRIDNIEINIGIFGGVLTGKSSLLNILSGKNLSKISVDKSTYLPQVYIDRCQNDYDLNQIQNVNDSMTEKFIYDVMNNNNTEYKPIYHYVNGFEKILNNNTETNKKLPFKIVLWDMPGFDICEFGNIYQAWLKNNIKKFDIIIYLTDNLTRLNCHHECLMFDFLISSVKKYNIKMICLMNKCDDLCYDEENNNLVINNDEQEKIFVKLNNIMANIVNFHNVNDNNYITPFLPISLKNYLHYSKIINDPQEIYDCTNLIGMTTGFENLEKIIENILTTNKLYFIVKYINNNLKFSKIKNIEDVLNYGKIIKKLKLDSIYDPSETVIHTDFWECIKNEISRLETSIIKECVYFIENKKNNDFKYFDDINTEIQTHLSILSSLDVFNVLVGFPKDFINYHKIKITSNLLNIYDMFVESEYKSQPHLCPSNVLLYLELINTNIAEEFDNYALKFLRVYTNSKIFTEKFQTDLEKLIIFIYKNISKNAIMSKYSIVVSNILIKKQIYMKNNHTSDYLQYLINVKKIIKQNIKRITNINPNPLDILYEVTKKNISIHLGENGLTIFNKQDLNSSVIEYTFNKFYTGNDIKITTDFESKILFLM
ncbi:hypothetical protein QLL95_gp0684 [Cotonvirus japonicus]|uniref:Dynamin N-terminal domain-containing protein n=1 Tax=Cotonvirus japonicus TaxID=2811091 RepID=A0ABM7NTI2_9VIRU|nr:hypothetical protein QLL95_gp0684 [Cotonvirus japonicus]BCS83439.1 hypothetical protein [Cotonvirus japonicus]